MKATFPDRIFPSNPRSGSPTNDCEDQQPGFQNRPRLRRGSSQSDRRRRVLRRRGKRIGQVGGGAGVQGEVEKGQGQGG